MVQFISIVSYVGKGQQHNKVTQETSYRKMVIAKENIVSLSDNEFLKNIVHQNQILNIFEDIEEKKCDSKAQSNYSAFSRLFTFLADPTETVRMHSRFL